MDKIIYLLAPFYVIPVQSALTIGGMKTPIPIPGHMLPRTFDFLHIFPLSLNTVCWPTKVVMVILNTEENEMFKCEQAFPGF